MTAKPRLDKAARERLEASLADARARGAWHEIVERAVNGYGVELMSYLLAIMRSEADAEDAFQELWRKLHESLESKKFQGRCSVRTWCYTLARHEASHAGRRRNRRREAALSDLPAAKEVETVIRSTTSVWRTTEAKDALAAVRATLPEPDQTLLILRADRAMSWQAIAMVVGDDGVRTGGERLTREANRLKKRYERLKIELREALAQRKPER